MKRIYGDDTARLTSYLDRNAPGGCWLWLRSCTAGGYGQMKVKGQVRYVHRLMYELVNGPIPEGMEIDHLCRVRACCNPAHLEAVTPGENWRRGQSCTRENALKTHCVHGHSLADAYITLGGRGRQCRSCALERRAAS